MTATLGLSSCESFLSENPKDQITEEQAYQNSTLLYLNTVASLYTQVGANGGGAGLQGTDRGLYDLNTFTTDEAMLPTRGGDWYDGGQYRELHMHAWTANTSAVKNAWSRSTEAISACNLIYETISTSALEESAKARALAEIRGVRAFWIYG